MNVLWLNAGLLLPLDKGGKLRTWHLMRQLAKRHDISYVSFADPDARPADLDGMREVCRSLDTIPRCDRPKGTWRFYVDAARYIPQPVPYAIAKYRSTAYRRRVRDLLGQKRFDVIVCDFLVPLVNLPEDLPCPVVLFTHNVEAEIWRRHAATAVSPVTRVLLRQQWRRMGRFEARALARCELVLTVSPADVATFSRLYPAAARRRMHVVHTGVDTEYFSPSPAPTRPAHLVFTGSMDWLPNEDAMRYFVDEVLPRIQAVEPAATLSIVGRDPTPAVWRLSNHTGVEVTGRVDDVRPEIARSQVYVVPLRIGGGTRLKIFEAMAMGRAVVSTTIGAEGLPVTPNRDIVIADEADAFARAVVDLIRNHDRRRRIEAAARQLVVDRYDWCAVAHGLDQSLTSVAVGPAGAHLSPLPARPAILPTASGLDNIGQHQEPG